MSKNPIINGVAASIYIFLLVVGMNYGTRMMSKQDSLMMPVAFISLFTLSAAVMGFLFCYQPMQLYFDGNKKQAVGLFIKTVGVFGSITILILVLLIFRVF